MTAQILDSAASADVESSLTPEERAQVLALGRSEQQPRVEFSIGESFERQVRKQPSAIAVVAGSRQVTYVELERLARVADARLHAAGVSYGDLVGAFCGSSPELIALILAIWRRGAVYVPLDPKYPSQRLVSIIRDATPRLIVHDRPLPDALPAKGLRTLDASTIFAGAPTEDMPFDGRCVALDDRAVVLYTSGSTGTPKGVVLTHGNLANHNAWVIRAFGLGPHDRRTALASINFDVSLEEFFCTLNAGSTLVLPEPGTFDSFERLLEFIEQNRLTAFFITTSLWRELTNYLAESGREFPASIRLLAVGGERATRTIYDRFLKVGGSRMRWVNVYGPTETAIYSTSYEHDPVRDAATIDAPPIGRPIDNTNLFVLDSNGRLVAPGRIGELYIGGAGVGEGYLHREDLTGERFVEQPSNDLPPARYYRTGDLVRFRPDGMLEYCGRIDDQVKLRGFRIEPGEVEAALLRHPAVRDAAVVVLRSPAGTQHLAAYLVLHAGAAWNEQELREFAERRLPEYMVPQVFCRLETLPLSPNGKVDRRALPEPCLVEVTAPSTEEHSCSPPLTPLQRQMLDIWQDTLKLERVGLRDDFFALGGDSLKAMALIARLEASLHRTIPPSTLLQARTVERLASKLEDDAPTASFDPTVLLREGDRSRPLFFVHALAGDAWIYCELVRALRCGSAMFGLQMQGLDGEVPPHDEVRSCAAEYLRRMRSIQPAGPYRIAGYSSGGWIAYEMTRQLAGAGERVEFLGLIDSGVPLALERSLTASRLGRWLGVLRNLPLYVRELAAMGFAERWQRIGRFVAAPARRALRRRRTAAGGNPADHGDILQWFAEDVSFFSEHRLQLIRRHYRALERYEPGTLAGAAQLFRVARQPMSSVQTPTLGWERLISGPVAVHNVPGTHHSLMRWPHIDQLAKAIDAVLDRLN